MPDERLFQWFAYFWKEHGRDAEWFGRQTWRQLQAYMKADAGPCEHDSIEAGLAAIRERQANPDYAG
jgi:hypothetical protein